MLFMPEYNFGILQLNSSTSGLYIMKRPSLHGIVSVKTCIGWHMLARTSVSWFLAYAMFNNYKPKEDRKSPLLMDAAEGH